MDIITYLYWDYSQSSLIKGAPGAIHAENWSIIAAGSHLPSVCLALEPRPQPVQDLAKNLWNFDQTKN